MEGAEAVAAAKNSSSVISPAASLRRLRQITVPEPTSSPSCQPSSMGPPDSTMAGMSTADAAIIAAGGEHHRVDGIAIEQFRQGHCRQISVDRGGGTPAILEHGMGGEFDGDAACLADPLAHPLGQF